MIEWIDAVFGIGKDLNAWQMGSRAVIIFIFTLFVIRISGRRSFGLRAPLDNIVIILLGSILGRAVVGASPFLPTLIAGLVISALHRSLAILSTHHWFGKITKGEKIPLYHDGAFITSNLKRSLISKEDVMEEMRLRALINSFSQIESAYMERNGEISVIKKQN